MVDTVRTLDVPDPLALDGDALDPIGGGGALIGYGRVSMRDGDTVIVHSMDRLARNLDDLRRLVRTLTGKGVRVEFVKESLTFTGEDSPMANLLLSVMGAFAEFERALILERQREGIAAAKARGAYTGRKPALTAEQADLLRARGAAGISKAALAREFDVSRETVYAICGLRPSRRELRGFRVRTPNRALVGGVRVVTF
ncbi:recombinase family protein [Nocardia sp. CY41]|uniref:recombinase family protein n=1 Tax=Nocardia sp. CY41 TaxID=2608686 RepID=UPI00135B18C0